MRRVAAVLAGRSPGVVTTDEGALARLLATDKPDGVARLVAPAARDALSSSILQRGWQEIAAVAGALRRVDRTVTVAINAGHARQGFRPG